MQSLFPLTLHAKTGCNSRRYKSFLCNDTKEVLVMKLNLDASCKAGGKKETNYFLWEVFGSVRNSLEGNEKTSLLFNINEVMETSLSFNRVTFYVAFILISFMNFQHFAEDIFSEVF